MQKNYKNIIKEILSPSLKYRAFAAVSSFFILIVAGTIFYHYQEGWNYINSFYFSITTLTTTGYGDLYPTKDITKLFTAFYLLIGVGTAVYALNILAKYYINIRMQISKRRNNGRFGSLIKK
jgi:hypothetical protein